MNTVETFERLAKNAYFNGCESRNLELSSYAKSLYEANNSLELRKELSKKVVFADYEKVTPCAALV